MPRHTKTPEGHLKTTVLDLLTAERIYALRVNSGTILMTGENGKKRAVVLAPKGTADILALVPHPSGYFQPLWLETKAPNGNQTPEQLTFAEEARDRGHAYLAVTSIEQVVAWLQLFRSLTS